MKVLTATERKVLDQLAARINPDMCIWFDCSLMPRIGDLWRCYICNNDFPFEETVFEIDAHGLQHLKEHNLLVFI